MRLTRGGGPPGLCGTWEGRRQCKEDDPEASVPGSHMIGNTHGAIGAPQCQYRGETGLGMEEAAPPICACGGVTARRLPTRSDPPGPALGPWDPWGEAGI